MPHTHLCITCPNALICHADPDQCAAPEPYVCPNCEQQQLDAYLTQHEPQPQPTPQEMTNEGF